MPATPQDRIVTLLQEALPLVAKDHPAYVLLEEATRAAAALDPYLDEYGTGIIVPKSHSLPEEQVRKTLDKLFKVTYETNWNAVYKSGKTKWELSKGMCSGAYEASFLQHIAVTAKAASVLEIGLFTGTTTLSLALLPDVKSIVALELEPYLEEFDRPYWKEAGVSDKIVTRIGDAKASLKALQEEGFKADLAFIDANKTGYLDYFKGLLDLDLLNPDGLILVDNTLYKGYPYADSINPSSPTSQMNSNNGTHDQATQGIIAFNEAARKDPRVDVVIVPVRDGVTMIRRKL